MGKVEKEIESNKYYWLDKYVKSIEQTNGSRISGNKAELIVSSTIVIKVKKIKDINSLVLSKEAKISPKIIKATLHDFFNYVTQRM